MLQECSKNDLEQLEGSLIFTNGKAKQMGQNDFFSSKSEPKYDTCLPGAMSLLSS